MKAFLFSLCAVCSFSTSSFAQVSTIQVSVSDTMEVPANHLTVVINFNDTSTTAEEPADFTPSRQAVIQLLETNKVTWAKASDKMGFLGAISRMAGDAGKLDNDLSIDFTSAAQMDALLPKIKAIAYVNAVEMGTSIDKGSVDMTGLYAKLLKKAQAKADLLARLSGKKVGAVYQIGSAFDAFSPSSAMESMLGGGNAYGQLMNSMMGNMFGEKRADRKVTVTEQLTVTYLLQ